MDAVPTCPCVKHLAARLYDCRLGAQLVVWYPVAIHGRNDHALDCGHAPCNVGEVIEGRR
jgi:hypothetical protein